MTDEAVEAAARAIRDACPTEEQCLDDEEECFRVHPIHEFISRDGVVVSVYAGVEETAKLAVAAAAPYIAAKALRDAAAWLAGDCDEGCEHYEQAMQLITRADDIERAARAAGKDKTDER